MRKPRSGFTALVEALCRYNLRRSLAAVDPFEHSLKGVCAVASCARVGPTPYMSSAMPAEQQAREWMGSQYTLAGCRLATSRGPQPTSLLYIYLKLPARISLYRHVWKGVHGSCMNSPEVLVRWFSPFCFDGEHQTYWPWTGMIYDLDSVSLLASTPARVRYMSWHDY